VEEERGVGTGDTRYFLVACTPTSAPTLSLLRLQPPPPTPPKKNNTNQIEHTVQWARDWFEGAFKQAPDDANAYLSNPEYLPHLKVQR
jgi:hypothetical protein